MIKNSYLINMKVLSFFSIIFFLGACASKTTVFQTRTVKVQLEKDQGALIIDKNYVRILKAEDTYPQEGNACKRKLSVEKKPYVECKKLHKENYPENKLEIVVFD